MVPEGKEENPTSDSNAARPLLRADRSCHGRGSGLRSVKQDVKDSASEETPHWGLSGKEL